MARAAKPRTAIGRAAITLAGAAHRGAARCRAGLYLVADPDRQSARHQPARARDAGRRRRHRLRGHPRHPQATEHYGIATPLTPYHEHNAAEARPKLLRGSPKAQAVALVSDAGTPLISDPGYRLVRAAREAGHAVIALPGASAVLAALGVAGLPTDRFFFEGFLPPKQAARQKRIAELAAIPATLVLFESGPRLAAALADLAAGLGRARGAICRELTKLHEEARRGDLDELARDYAEGAETRGEIVIVVAPPADEQAPRPTTSTSCCAARWPASRSRTRSAKWRSPPAGRAARSISARSRSPRMAAMARDDSGRKAPRATPLNGRAAKARSASGTANCASASASRPRAAPRPG